MNTKLNNDALRAEGSDKHNQDDPSERYLYDPAIDEPIADETLAESTIAGVRSVLSLIGASRLYYQNFALSKREGSYYVSDKMTGELLLGSNCENKLCLNRISPYAAAVLKDACIQEKQTVQTFEERHDQEVTPYGSERFSLFADDPWLSL